LDRVNYWEEIKKTPIPLGGIVIKRNVDAGIQKQVDELIRKSLAYSFENYPVITSYVREHSQEMDESVMRQHIDLYVNNYSTDLGEDGKKAVRQLLDIYRELNGSATIDDNGIFI
jgi:1,4-dihydroxy-6-naphthoate synthase